MAINTPLEFEPEQYRTVYNPIEYVASSTATANN